MIIRTKQDAGEFVTQIKLFTLIEGIKRIKIKRGSVDIALYDDMWIGHCNRNIIKLCPSHDSIVDFIYKHRRALNQNAKQLNSKDDVLAKMDWEQVHKIIRDCMEAEKYKTLDQDTNITKDEYFSKIMQDYDEELRLKLAEIGDERIKALLMKPYQDEDEICKLLEELEEFE